MKSLSICTFHHILLGYHNKYGWGKMYARERRGRGKKISVHLLKRRDLFEDLGIGGRIKLE